eukprot:CAMPEP_0177791554 /NCGR_PEP_ID=MMETSP0491_2-20121128/23999_1 /TAXON_ID=63592 /ORGANISM="Tetraselmis chuii, Strain PLY429" /LENGTH=144 /DNA_ID=CAMNT_0019313801 /DNA_START=19 /DNA_END=455 /DNA_ORIENTATION=+
MRGYNELICLPVYQIVHAENNGTFGVAVSAEVVRSIEKLCEASDGAAGHTLPDALPPVATGGAVLLEAEHHDADVAVELRFSASATSSSAHACGSLCTCSLSRAHSTARWFPKTPHQFSAVVKPVERPVTNAASDGEMAAKSPV